MSPTYNLKLINNSFNHTLDELIKNNLISNREWLHMDKEYYMMKYNKNALIRLNDDDDDDDDINDKYGLTKQELELYRSVIHRNGKIMAFSPPKSLPEDIFMSKNPPNKCYAEEIIDGTMINLFYDNETNKWEIATKSSFGANNNFFINYNPNSKNNGSLPHQQKTFRSMFFDVCKTIGFDYKTLPKEYCYSFVFQHQLNRIVIPITQHKLYLIAAYSIDNEKYNVTKLSESKTTIIFNNTKVMFPHLFSFETYDDIQSLICFMDEDYKNVGIMIHHTPTGERTKIINPNYKFVRGLRSNQPKQKYRLLELMKNNKITPYLRYFPEEKEQFNVIKNEVYKFTEELHSNYIQCYIKKKKPLLEFEKKQFQTHMYNLHHTIYKEKLQEKNKHVTKQVVIGYVNSLPTSVLMSVLNYDTRKISESEE